LARRRRTDPPLREPGGKRPLPRHPRGGLLEGLPGPGGLRSGHFGHAPRQVTLARGIDAAAETKVRAPANADDPDPGTRGADRDERSGRAEDPVDGRSVADRKAACRPVDPRTGPAKNNLQAVCRRSRIPSSAPCGRRGRGPEKDWTRVTGAAASPGIRTGRGSARSGLDPTPRRPRSQPGSSYRFFDAPEHADRRTRAHRPRRGGSRLDDHGVARQRHGPRVIERGPGRDLRTYMPGQNRLVYIAGHRTTYLAPFSPRHELLRLQACHPRVLRHAAASSMHGS
jgi:hypothetical protein